MSKDLYNIKNVINYQINSVGRKSPLDHEEMYQLGYLGYLKAQKNFKVEYGKMTLNYAVPYIRDEILTSIKKAKKIRSVETRDCVRLSDASQKARTYTNTDEATSFIENYAQPDTSHPVDLDTLETVKKAMKYLNPIEIDIIENVYLNKDTKKLKDIADKHGITISTLYSLKARCLKKLRKRICER